MARPWSNPASGFVNGDLLMHYLKDQSAIASNVVGFYMTTFAYQSSVDIGGLDTSKYRAGQTP